MTSPEIIQELLFVLIDVADEIEGRVDVVDGSYGEPAPNWAMKLWTHLDRAIKLGEAHLKTLQPDVSSTKWTGLPFVPNEAWTRGDEREWQADCANDEAALEDKS